MRFILMLFVIATMAACSSSKKTTPVTETTEVATKVDPQEPEVPAQPEDPKLSKTYPDSLFARLERTPCYGRCPTFIAEIYKSGRTVYVGRRNVDHEGRFIVQLTQKEMDLILETALAIDYWRLESVYDSGITDIPSCYSYVNNRGRGKAIKARHKVPPQLREFHDMIDEMIHAKEFKPVE